MSLASRRSSSMAASGRRWLVVTAGAVACVCGAVISLMYLRQPPKIPASQMRYLQLLSTAISSENAQQVAMLGDLLKGQHQAKEISDRQWGEFQKILDHANRQEWGRAMKGCERLKAAQLGGRR